MPTTVKGVPYPAPTEANDVPADLQALATWLDANALIAAQRGAANGVASLGADAKILSSQLPAIALNETFSVANEAAMLALVAQPGDVAIRADVASGAGRFLLTQAPPATSANWIRLLLPTDGVVSVDGRAGAVTLADLYAALAHNHAAADVASGVLATARLGSGVAAAGKYVDGAAGAWTALPVATGSVVARTAYAPTTPVTYTNTSSGRFMIDSTNLAVTFVAPTTQVDVTLQALISASNGDNAMGWSLCNGTTLASPVAGSNGLVHSGLPQAAIEKTKIRATSSFRVTGLTIGTSYTWTWVYLRTVFSGSIHVYAGGAADFDATPPHWGAAIMEVRSA